MTMNEKTISLSVGPDYKYPAGMRRYEFCLFSDDELIHRAGGFKSTATAKNAGKKHALAQLEGENI